MAGTLTEKVDAMDLDDGKQGSSAPAAPTDKGDDSRPSGDESTNKREDGTSGRSEDGGKPDPKTEGGDESGKPSGYEADTGDDELDEQPPDDKPAAAPQNLPPDLQYVVDNLPTLTVRGRTSEHGVIKSFQVKAAGQLPEEFQFVSKREELLFNQALAGQELKAQNLQQEYNQKEQQKQSDDFTEKENADIRKAIGDLQREGKIEKFKRQPDDPKFSDDAGVKQAQEVIDFMNQSNQKYLETFQKSGGVLYHMDFRTAYNILQMNKETGNSPTNQEDQQRRQVTRQLKGASGAPSNGTSKPRQYRSMDALIESIVSREF